MNFKRNIVPRFHKDYHGDPARRQLAMAQLTTDYYIHGDVTEDQKEMLLEELASCPIHNTLTTPPKLTERIHVLKEGEEPPKHGD